ncbi:hypothetical protein KN10_1978 [Anoxybacillus flavithermus NBRC 109594]|uniref:Uncharacterized protein n=1 Tax=Anoxybacillus flavithermus NBRC 109594 TaxID=1315967 RepID=R4G6U5_9BACL|nr:hypothetical protein KN10_1978 [Anoxybacillus flavithermus NBRC 109594]
MNFITILNIDKGVLVFVFDEYVNFFTKSVVVHMMKMFV